MVKAQLEFNYEKEFKTLKTDYDKLMEALIGDLSEINTQIKSNDNQTWRRLYVKSMCSAIDSQLSFFKNHIKLIGNVDYLCLSEREEAILYGFKGTKTFRKLSFLDDVTFTIELFSDINYAFLKLDKKTKEWHALVLLVKVRNRITHPKTFQDIIISNRDIKICEQGFNGFQEMIDNLMKACVRSLQKTSNALLENMKKIKSE